MFYFQKINYFFSLLPIFIPLIWNCYLFFAEELADKNIKFFSAHLTLIPSTKEGFNKICFKNKDLYFDGAISIENEQDNLVLLHWFVDNLDIYTNIKNFILRIKEAEYIYKRYEKLYVYVCYLIGWSFILYLSLYTLPIVWCNYLPLYYDI